MNIPDNLPQYKKNAYTIFHQLLTRIDELTVELNIRKMQIASLFVSIQQVEIERCKENETTEEYNRRKAIANLTKARYRKRMEILTKQFKKGTKTTYNYSMPKPTNKAVLTDTLSKDFPEEVISPNIENNIDDELTKLGISSTLLTTTDSKTNQQGLKKTSNRPSLVSQAASSSSRTIQQEEKSTQETDRTTMKQQYNDAQMNQDGSKKISTFPSSVSHAALSSSQRRIQEQGKTRQEISRTTLKQQKDDALVQKVQLQPQSTTQGDKPDMFEQQCQAKKTEAAGMVNHVCARKPGNRILDESNMEDQEWSLSGMSPPGGTSHAPAVQPLKLSQKEYQEAYPWADEASKNAFNKTELSNEVEYINISQCLIGNYLTSRMRNQLKENINLPDVVIEKVNNCIGITTINQKPTYFCKVCNMNSPYNHPKRAMCARHVRIHLGYSLYRCSVCDFISSTKNCLFALHC